MKIFNCLVVGLLSLGILSPVFSDEKSPEPKVVKMEEIKQELTGLDKEYSPGKVIKVKISPLPKMANKITAVYKLTLLENGKKSSNCEVLTKVERSDEQRKEGSDFIFAIEYGKNVRYQVLFAVTYIEQNAAKEIVMVHNPDINVYDVKTNNPSPGPDVDPDVPNGTYGFIKLVYTECQKLKIDPEKKQKLFTNVANAFSGMSSKIAAGVFKDSDNENTQTDNISNFLRQTKIENNTAIKNSDINENVFDGNIDIAVKAKLEELFNAGKLRKFADYQAIWAEISEGYRLAAKN